MDEKKEMYEELSKDNEIAFLKVKLKKYTG